MGYARVVISVVYSDQSDFSDPVVRNLTSGYSLPSGVSAYMPVRDAAPSGGQTIFTSTMSSGYGAFFANRGTASALHVAAYTSAGACSAVIPSGGVSYMPHFLPASNITVSGAPSGAAVPFEALLLGI